jgi:hypothetical protein
MERLLVQRRQRATPPPARLSRHRDEMAAPVSPGLEPGSGVELQAVDRLVDLLTFSIENDPHEILFFVGELEDLSEVLFFSLRFSNRAQFFGMTGLSFGF